jgi:hypothetical protein
VRYTGFISQRNKGYADMPMKKATRDLREKYTPAYDIEIGKFNIEQYWTSPEKLQVVTVVFKCNLYFSEHRTNGHGYCKMSAGLEATWPAIGIIPRLQSKYGDKINNAYHVGGNFYRVPKKDIRKFK